MKRIISSTLLALLLPATLLSSACSSLLPPPEYDVAYSTPEGEPVWIEKVVYDRTWRGLGGIMFCCWKDAGRTVAARSRPVPKEIYIYWFNYRQQKFYEATVQLPPDTEARMRKLPKPRFGGPIITTGVLPDGTVVVWISNGLSERMGTWIEMARAQGKVAKGDPNSRRNTTEEMRRRGEI